MVNYQNGKIYKIFSSQTEDIYIGSTCQTLLCRLSQHVSAYKQHKKGKSSYVTSFEIIGHNDYKIELVEDYPCNIKKDLLTREQHWQDEFPSCINKAKACVKNSKGINYQNGKIYKITSCQTDKCYIGSTTSIYLAKRLADHRADYKRYLDGNYQYVTSFEIVKYDDAIMTLLESFPCNNKEELLTREQHYIGMNVCINKVRPIRTREEELQYFRDLNKTPERKEQFKKSYIKNNNKIRERDKKYRDTNKEKIKERDKKYREVNKKQISERRKHLYRLNINKNKDARKRYYEKNKDNIKESNKQYREENKEKLKENVKRRLNKDNNII